MAKKLSPRMQHVLARMREGYKLTTSTAYGMGSGAMLSHPDKSGWENPSISTVQALEDRGLIVRHYGFPSATYTLVAAPNAKEPTPMR